MSGAADQAPGPRHWARPADRRSVGATVLVIIAALAIAMATLVGTPDAKRDAPRLDVREVSGDVVISNSKEGQPIVSVANLKPGEAMSGEVTLENTGTARGFFYLAPLDLVSDPGPGGGELADNVIVRVFLTKGARTRKPYTGLLSKMGTRQAGRYRPGETGIYEFEVEARDTGVPARPTLSRPYRGDNKYQGTSASVTFGWSLTR